MEASPPRNALKTTTDFKGRAALVTGGGRGVGRAIALELAAAGAQVAIVSRTAEQLQEVAAAMQAAHGRPATVITADMGDASQTAEVARRVESELGPVDILVNNAAVVWPLASTTAIDPAEWEAAAQINLFGPIRLTMAVLPGMVERGWGRIVNVSSAIVPIPERFPRGNAYVTAKAGLEAHTVNLSAELEGTGVTVNVFRPGEVDTSMQAWVRGQDPAQVGDQVHAHFMGNLENGTLLTPEHSAGVLIEQLRSGGNGERWDAATAA